MGHNSILVKPDDYWKLKRYDGLSMKEMKEMLEQRHYHISSTSDKLTLQVCLRKSDRGLISYVKCNNEELRGMIRRRKIVTHFNQGNKGQRQELIRILEYEDHNREFNRFMDLPAEMRNRIYEYYYAEFDEPLHAPKQPPLTLTCSQIRQESLPMFYATCTFDFFLQFDTYHVHGLHDKLKRRQETFSWLHSTEEKHIAHIRSIRVGVSAATVTNSDPTKTLLSFLFDRTKEDGRIRTPILSSSLNQRFGGFNHKELLRQLNRVCKEGTDPITGVFKMEREVFWKLRRAAELAMK